MPHFVIKPAVDNMKATFEPVSEVGTGVKNKQEAKARLKELGIVYGIDQEAIITAFAINECLESVTVASGRLCGTPINAQLKFEIDMSSVPVFVADPDANKIDYKEAMQIPLVKAGDLLGEYIPAQKGVSGVNIFGQELPGLLGESLSYTVGDGVRKEGNKFFAINEGRPSFILNKLEVSNLLEINGDVCLETGNIDFPGSVLIKGSISDGFTVKCSGMLDVAGVIGDATVNIGGLLRVKKGIIGKGNCHIYTKGGMELGFASNSNLTSKGDICITKNLLHCKTYSLGRVRIERGSIIGGEVVSIKGVESMEIGSESGVNTRITVRTNYEIILLQEAFDKMLNEVDGVFQRSRLFLAQGQIPENDTDQVVIDLNLLASHRAKLARLDEQIKFRVEESRRADGVCICVHKKVHPDVTFMAPGCKLLVQDDIIGNKVFVDDIDLSSMVVKNE